MFEHIVAVDWSARSKPSRSSPEKDAIFLCHAEQGVIAHPRYFRTRHAAIVAVSEIFERALHSGTGVLAGFDFAFGYPVGFAGGLTGSASALAVWQWLAARIEDDAANANNRFQIAAEMNRHFPGIGPFWGRPGTYMCDEVPEKGSLRHSHGMAERRVIEEQIRTAQPTWKLFTTGSVGSQSLLGLPQLQGLRARFGSYLQVWPLETGWRVPTAPLVLAEIYPSMWAPSAGCRLAQDFPGGGYDILDAAQVRWVVEGLATRLAHPDALFSGSGAAHIACEEGWILGVAPPGSSQTSRPRARSA